MQDGIVSVTPTWVDRYTTGLVNNDNAIHIPHDLDRQVGDWRFMPMNVVCNNVAILDDIVLVHFFSIDLDSPVLDSPFL